MRCGLFLCLAFAACAPRAVRVPGGLDDSVPAREESRRSEYGVAPADRHRFPIEVVLRRRFEADAGREAFMLVGAGTWNAAVAHMLRNDRLEIHEALGRYRALPLAPDTARDLRERFETALQSREEWMTGIHDAAEFELFRLGDRLESVSFRMPRSDSAPAELLRALESVARSAERGDLRFHVQDAVPGTLVVQTSGAYGVCGDGASILVQDVAGEWRPAGGGDAVVRPAHCLPRTEAKSVAIEKARAKGRSLGYAMALPGDERAVYSRIDRTSKRWSLTVFDARSDREMLVSIEPDRRLLSAVAWIPSRSRILAVRRADGRFPTATYLRAADEYWFVDATTSGAERVTAEVRPWLRPRTSRDWQPANDGGVWVAIHDDDRDAMLVGRYDPERLVLTTVREYPRIDFSSNRCWIDERNRFVWVAYEQALLRLPL